MVAGIGLHSVYSWLQTHRTVDASVTDLDPVHLVPLVEPLLLTFRAHRDRRLENTRGVITVTTDNQSYFTTTTMLPHGSPHILREKRPRHIGLVKTDLLVFNRMRPSLLTGQIAPASVQEPLVRTVAVYPLHAFCLCDVTNHIVVPIRLRKTVDLPPKPNSYMGDRCSVQPNSSFCCSCRALRIALLY